MGYSPDNSPNNMDNKSVRGGNGSVRPQSRQPVQNTSDPTKTTYYDNYDKNNNKSPETPPSPTSEPLSYSPEIKENPSEIYNYS